MLVVLVFWNHDPTNYMALETLDALPLVRHPLGFISDHATRSWTSMEPSGSFAAMLLSNRTLSLADDSSEVRCQHPVLIAPWQTSIEWSASGCIATQSRTVGI